MLSVHGVSRHYPRSPRPAVHSASFTVDQGTTLAIVGESGAGKSTLCRMLVGLEPPDTGHILLDGEPVTARPGRVSRLQMVFQDPFSSLNPLHSIGWSVAEPMLGLSRPQRRAEVGRLLTLVGIPAGRSAELIVGMLATWRAGAAFLLLDPTYPAARTRGTSASCRSPCLATESVALITSCLSK